MTRWPGSKGCRLARPEPLLTAIRLQEVGNPLASSAAWNAVFELLPASVADEE
jgi:hypothetical protein